MMVGAVSGWWLQSGVDQVCGDDGEYDKMHNIIYGDIYMQANYVINIFVLQFVVQFQTTTTSQSCVPEMARDCYQLLNCTRS